MTAKNKKKQNGRLRTLLCCLCDAIEKAADEEYPAPESTYPPPPQPSRSGTQSSNEQIASPPARRGDLKLTLEIKDFNPLKPQNIELGQTTPARDDLPAKATITYQPNSSSN